MTGARLLDLTRSLRRTGRGPTGIDRVERAYLTFLIDDDVAFHALVRTRYGYLMLDAEGARCILSEQLTEAAVRQVAYARCAPFRLRHMLARHLGSDFAYFNVGHSNLTDRVFQSVGAAGGQSHVMVHDVIPLEHPSFQREGTVEPFRDKMQKVSRWADLVIFNTDDTKARAESFFSTWGRVPPSIVAHLGVTTSPPDLMQKIPKQPYFITLGTIEPRKNHAFLLDLWEQMGSDAPPLLICGARGWRNQDVFRRLDNLPSDSQIKEQNNLPDGAISALLRNSAGLLFPSHAEGFGLPAVEALTTGTRVLCNDLPVFREVLGPFGHFLPVTDSKSWLESLKKWERNPNPTGAPPGFQAASWEDHFNTVLTKR